ncbi:hypothetical protein [Mordavella massiliensis]|uniref:Uncharacterized protein n=1 Tax=Mordavella massiliensis TaxID=1871024 RepID=A0A938XE05_9CLOT|nr:hypothetical protein [Mordavella massiliensis]MBM6949317.1 hypothetical protein [Mordavella massiliensis]
MKEVAKIIPDREFREFLDKLAEEVRVWKEKDHMGYVSVTCELAKYLAASAGSDHEMVFTAGQIKQVMDLAK